MQNTAVYKGDEYKYEKTELEELAEKYAQSFGLDFNDLHPEPFGQRGPIEPILRRWSCAHDHFSMEILTDEEGNMAARLRLHEELTDRMLISYRRFFSQSFAASAPLPVDNYLPDIYQQPIDMEQLAIERREKSLLLETEKDGRIKVKVYTRDELPHVLLTGPERLDLTRIFVEPREYTFRDLEKVKTFLERYLPAAP